MISKPSGLALSAMAFLCAAALVACSSAPTLQFVTVAPTSGTIYVSAAPAGGVKGTRRAVRPVSNSKRRAAVTLRDITTASCGSLQFAATALFSNGTTQDESTSATWTSSSTSVATVDNTGLATGVGLGNTNISAYFNGITATAAALEVDQLNTITMNPTSGNIPNGTTGFAFMALGNFTLASGSSAQQDISSQVTWASSNTNVATVDTAGNITTVGQGTTNITATSCDGITVGTAVLTVTPQGSFTLSASPSSLTVAEGGTGTSTITVTPVNGFSSSVSLSASGLPSGVTASFSPNITTNTSTLTFSASSAATIGTATVTVTGSSGSLTNPTTVSLTVGAPTPTLQISPAALTAATGTTVVFSALEIPSGGGTGHAPSNPVTWQSDTPSVATIDPNTGLAVAIAPGTANISATETVTGYTGPAAVLTVQTAAARYAYVGNVGSTAPFTPFISSYTVSVSSGTLTHQADVIASSGVQQVLLHPSGDLLYYIDAGSSLHSFSVNSTTGVLTPTNLTPSIDSCMAPDTSIGVIDPLGRFIYVVNLNGQCIFGYSITQPNSGGTAGTLTLIPGNATTGITDPVNLAAPNWVMTDRSGKYLYVLNNTIPGNITEYNIDQTTGALTLMSTPSVPAGNGTTNSPFYGTTDLNGHLFVANQGSSTTDETVSAYTITSTGQLQSVGADTVITGATATVDVLTDPTGKFIYVLDAPALAGQVFTFGLNSSTGVIGSQVGTAQPTGIGPTVIALDPTGALMAINNYVDGTISLFQVSSGVPGTPTLLTTGSKPVPVVFYTAASGQ